MQHDAKYLPLISVIIPTYNYAQFLPKAIGSVLQQSYPNIEIIIIDDGSTDHTSQVIPAHPAIKYFYQKNKGLAAARNAGIDHSHGSSLVFLDADDWLEKDGLFLNFKALQAHQEIAFISGNYKFLRADSGRVEKITVNVTDHHYEHLLKCNYVGMHATVMFQRWALEHFRYDESLRACEDYDLYLRITRQFPVMHHQEFIATYYFHSCGLSHNYKLMIDALSAVMKKQAPFIMSAGEKKAYALGLLQWKDYDELLIAQNRQ